jgi:hypothetical protein
MAKNESTAVNELIELASIKPVLGDDDDGLFSSPASAQKASPRPQRSSAGIQAPAPDPLPRTRAPSGTQTNIHAAPPAIDGAAPTAPVAGASRPTRLTTIPPPNGQAAASEPGKQSLPPLPTVSRTQSRPSVPPPTPSRPGIPLPNGQPPQSGGELFARRGASSTLPPPNGTTPRATPIPGNGAAPIDTASADGWSAPVVDRQPTPIAAPMPMPMPSNAGIPLPQLPQQSSAALRVPPSAVPRAPVIPASATGPIGTSYDAELHGDDWFEASRAVDKLDENMFGTQQVQRQLRGGSPLQRFALPIGGIAIVGVFVGGYFALRGGNQAPAAAAPAPAVTQPVAAIAPAAAPQVAPLAAAAAPSVAPIDSSGPSAPKAANPAVAAAAVAVAPVAAVQAVDPNTAAPAVAVTPPNEAAPTVAVVPANQAAAAIVPAPVAVAVAPVAAPVPGALEDIRIDSQPAGATVMIVDRGKTSFLGTTPVSASVDPGRSYDVVLTLAGHPTQVEHLDPRATTHLAIVLGQPGNQVPATPSVAVAASPVQETPAPAPQHHHVAATTHADAPAPVHHAEHHVAHAEQAESSGGGAGTLMISSKPPCQILVDGRATGLNTPQRAMSLPAGAHRITLLNPAESIKKTFAVQITASKSTKLIENLMN